MITAPYLFEELFALFNKRISNYVKIIPLDLWYRFVFSDGKTFDTSLTFQNPKSPDGLNPSTLIQSARRANFFGSIGFYCSSLEIVWYVGRYSFNVIGSSVSLTVLQGTER